MRVLNELALIVTTTVAIVCVLVPGIRGAQPNAGADVALRHFENNVADYLALRQRAATSVHVPTITSDPDALLMSVNQLAYRIRAARPHARQGDVLSSDIARIFCNRIQNALRERGISSSEQRARLREHTSASSSDTMKVNGRFDWGATRETPTEILAVLPVLPDPLEYKLVGRALLLVDVEADLVVDILADVLPAD